MTRSLLRTQRPSLCVGGRERKSRESNAIKLWVFGPFTCGFYFDGSYFLKRFFFAVEVVMSSFFYLNGRKGNVMFCLDFRKNGKFQKYKIETRRRIDY